jgi:hypothetical protein
MNRLKLAAGLVVIAGCANAQGLPHTFAGLSGSVPASYLDDNFNYLNINKTTTALSSGAIFVGNGSNVAVGVAMSGDAALSNIGALTLANSDTTRLHLGLGSAATANTGTSGSSLGFLNTGNTWSASQTFTVAPLVSVVGVAGTENRVVTLQNNTAYSAGNVATLGFVGSSGGSGNVARVGGYSDGAANNTGFQFSVSRSGNGTLAQQIDSTGATTFYQGVNSRQTLVGSAVYPVVVTNTDATNGAAAGVYFDPGAAGVGVRGAYINVTTNGSNAETMRFGLANSSTPVTKFTLFPGGSTGGQLDTFSAGGISTPLILNNAATWSSGQGAQLQISPAGSAAGAYFRSVAASASNDADMEMFTYSGGVPHEPLILNTNGSVRLPEYTAGVLTTDGSGNVSAGAALTLSVSGNSDALIVHNLTKGGNWSVGPFNDNQDGTSSDLCWKSAAGNVFTGYSGCWSGHDGRFVVSSSSAGVVNPRVNTGIQVIGSGSYATYPNGNVENTTFDGIAYNGFATMMGERYDINGGFAPVLANEFVSVHGGTAYDGTSNNTIGGMAVWSEETQVHGSANGGAVGLYYFASGMGGSRHYAVAINAGGNGGVTLGPTSIAPLVGGTDRGPGTLSATGDVSTDNHLTTTGAAFGHPSPSSCGTGSSFTGGTDQAGYITTGTGGPTSCVVTFAKQWVKADGSPQTPVCQVQLYNSNAVTAWVSVATSSAFTANFSGAYTSGVFDYICMGIG